MFGRLIAIFTCNFQDGDIWTFSVRSDSKLPDRTVSVNYDGFAEGILPLTALH